MMNAHLTPVMQLIVDEGLLDVPNPEALTQRLSRGLLKDIHNQALYTLGSWPYEDRKDSAASSVAFGATLGSALDPFSDAGKCTELGCRMATAKNFARSVALYVDEAIVTDPITSALMFDEHRSLKGFAHDFYLSLQVLKTLLPLIEDGALRFASPARSICAHCMEQRMRLTAEGLKYVERLVTESGLRVEISTRRDGKDSRLKLFCPKLFGSGQHELNGSYRLSKAHTKQVITYLGNGKREGQITAPYGEPLAQYVRYYVTSLVGDVVYQMTAAGQSGSTFFSGSRLETAFLASLEQTAPSGAEIEEWEAVRSVQLPWVRSLSVDQIVQLRHEAPNALSHLRASLAERLGGGGDASGSVADFVKELRLQSVELENALAAYRHGGGRRLALALRQASLAFVLYGFVADASMVPTALATAITTLATLHPTSKAEQVETAKLKGRAPYVLVHAKQMLSHQG